MSSHTGCAFGVIDDVPGLKSGYNPTKPMIAAAAPPLQQLLNNNNNGKFSTSIDVSVDLFYIIYDCANPFLAFLIVQGLNPSGETCINRHPCRRMYTASFAFFEAIWEVC